jgi:trypsin-like peptidase
VIVIGNPEGLEGTISEGIVAAIRDKPRLIQITAPISPGSSGSPIIDEQGSVLGVATLTSKEGQNLNFAIPGDEVTRALASIPKEAHVIPLMQGLNANREEDQVGLDTKAIDDLEKQHKESEALRLVNQFLRNHPGDVGAWSLKAKILGSLNLGVEAVEAQKTAIKIDGDNPGVWADMVFYLSLVAGSTPKPSGIESEIRSSAEHAIALLTFRHLLRISIQRLLNEVTSHTDSKKSHVMRIYRIRFTPPANLFKRSSAATVSESQRDSQKSGVLDLPACSTPYQSRKMWLKIIFKF